WRYRTHARHRLVTGCRQREERQFDDDGQDDDRPAPVTQQRVDILQQPENWLGDEPEDAVVDGQAQTRRKLFKLVLALGTGVQLGTGLALGAGGYAERRPGEADDVVALAVLARLHLIDLIGRRDPGGDEVMLQPGDPTTLDRFAKALVVHVTHGDLGVGLVLGPERGTQVSRGAGCSARGRIATTVTLELAEHVAGPGLAALVID